MTCMYNSYDECFSDCTDCIRAQMEAYKESGGLEDDADLEGDEMRLGDYD